MVRTGCGIPHLHIDLIRDRVTGLIHLVNEPGDDPPASVEDCISRGPNLGFRQERRIAGTTDRRLIQQVADERRSSNLHVQLSYQQVFVVHGPTGRDLSIVWALAGIAILLAVLLRDPRKRAALNRSSLLAAQIVMGVFPIIALLAALAIYREFSAAKERYRRGGYSVVEGTVADFVPGSSLAHRTESFRVGRQRFRYLSAVVSPYYHRTADQGGLVRPGLAVRISYRDGNILRLEVAR
jgi:hypothetical protein